MIFALAAIILSVIAQNTPTTVQMTAEPKAALITVRKRSQDSVRYIKGIVKDSTDKQPLIGGAVLIKGQKIITVAGIEGEFILGIPAWYKEHNITLEFRSLGFVTRSLNVSLAGDTTTIKEDIFLQRQEVNRKFKPQQDPGDTLLPPYIHPWLRLERHKNATFRKRIDMMEIIEI